MYRPGLTRNAEVLIPYRGYLIAYQYDSDIYETALLLVLLPLGCYREQYPRDLVHSDVQWKKALL